MEFSLKDQKFKRFLTVGALPVILATGFLINNVVNSPEKNEQYLKDKGYSSIHIAGYNFMCSPSATLKSRFTAIDPKGQEVEGSLCGGGREFLGLTRNGIETRSIENKTNKPKR